MAHVLLLFVRLVTKLLVLMILFYLMKMVKITRRQRQQKLTPPDPNLNKQPKNRKIITPKDHFFEGTLEDMIDHSKRTTIGCHFIYKELIDKTDRFTCTLCTRTSNCEKLKKDKV